MIHLDCQRLIFGHLGLVFTSDGVRDGIIIRSEERFDLVKIKLRCRKQSFWLQLRFHRLRSSESQPVGVASRSRRITGPEDEPCDWFILPPLLTTTTIWFSLDRKRRSHKHNRKKWKCSDSCDSDSVALTTPLTTPLCDLHKIASALTTPITTPTPSLVKTSLTVVLWWERILFLKQLFSFFITPRDMVWIYGPEFERIQKRWTLQIGGNVSFRCIGPTVLVRPTKWIKIPIIHFEDTWRAICQDPRCHLQYQEDTVDEVVTDWPSSMFPSV